jgi:hypothetical protein
MAFWFIPPPHGGGGKTKIQLRFFREKKRIFWLNPDSKRIGRGLDSKKCKNFERFIYVGETRF